MLAGFEPIRFRITGVPEPLECTGTALLTLNKNGFPDLARPEIFEKSQPPEPFLPQKGIFHALNFGVNLLQEFGFASGGGARG